VTGLPWCCVVRFASSCPVSLTGPLPRRRVVFLERTFSPQALPVDPALFLSSCPDGTPFRFSGHAFNAPTLKPEPFLARFLAPRTSPNSGQKSPSPVAPIGGRSGQSGTLLEATGGTQTHSRRTRSKLGQLRCARQALVRVPESNTKYGGNLGKTGGAPHPQCRQVSVSPQGFPSEKNCLQRADLSFAPLFTGQLFIPLQGLPRRDSRDATGVSGLACPATDSLALG